jgi:L-ascorbate 6-phosphate lactonase
MNTLAARIADRKIPQGQIVAWWLGGSGFIFKTPSGTRVCIDPYLSNSAEPIFGIGRGFPTPITPEELNADVVICTHTHEDHLDPGCIPQIAHANVNTQFIMPPSAFARAVGWGIHKSRITTFVAGSQKEVAGVHISHTPARHDAGFPGWETPDAMGVYIKAEGLTIYQTGDTEYDIRLRLLRDKSPDVAIVCINGAGGNMDAHEAALLCWEIRAKIVIPMHHILWDRKLGNESPTLDPQLFVDTYHKLGGKARVMLPTIGGELVLHL